MAAGMTRELQSTSLRECLEKIIDYRGKTPKKLGSDWVAKGYRALSAINVKDTGLTNVDAIRCIDAETYKKWMKEEVRRGDILLTSEAPAGEVVVWDSDEKIVLSQRLFCLRANQRFDNRFIKYYLQSPTGKREVNRTRSGSTVAGISAEMFDQIQVVHPALDSQREIAAVLSALDAKIDLNRRINAELEALAKTIYDYWFVQFDFPDANGRPYKSSGGAMVWNDALKREIPAGWEVDPLGELVEEIRGGIAPSSIGANTPYVGLEHIARKSIVLDQWAPAASATSNKTAFRAGDILFGKIRPYFHKVGLATMDGIASTDAIVLRPKNAALSGVAVQIVFSDRFVESATASSTGSKMPRADWSVLKRYSVALPVRPSPLIVRYQSVFASVATQLANHVRQTRELTRLRDWLLPLLMNGQVRVA